MGPEDWGLHVLMQGGVPAPAVLPSTVSCSKGFMRIGMPRCLTYSFTAMGEMLSQETIVVSEGAALPMDFKWTLMTSVLAVRATG